MKKIIISLVIVLLVSGCTLNSPIGEDNLSAGTDYKVLSESPFNESACESISYKGDASESGFGIKLKMIDSESGDEIKGSASLEMAGGASSMGDAYTCLVGGNIYSAVITAYSEGYSPKVVGIVVPQNKLVVLELSMVKSCTTGKSCFENAEIYSNLTSKGDYTNYVREWTNETISREFGLESSEYTLTCIECNMGRGGHIKAKGKFSDNSSFSLYYRSGWCSSGGSDCGYTYCFDAENKGRIESAKQLSCNSLSFRQQHYEGMCPYSAYDITNETIEDCLAGKYMYEMVNSTLFTFIQESNRCSSEVRQKITDCISS